MKEKIWIFLLIIVLVLGCGKTINNDEERMELETQISVANYEWETKDVRPIEYGIIVNKDFDVQVTLTKYGNNKDENMSIKVEIPKQFQIIDGNTEWEGKDSSKSFNLKLKAESEGKYELIVVGTNIKNGF